MQEPEVIYEDSDILVINKPSGLTVNRSDTTKGEVTLQDFVSGKINSENSDDTEFMNRGGIVHRLDKETSGIILVAKNALSFRELQRQFKERIVEKEYIALVHGVIAPSKGEINAPVGRTPWNRKRFGVVSGGRDAKTFYKSIESFDLDGEKVTLVMVHPKTGRTHQIRVHMKYIGHPVFGDPLYSGRKTSRTSRQKLERVFLHAYKIEFVHPKTHREMKMVAELPEDLRNILGEKFSIIKNKEVLN